MAAGAPVAPPMAALIGALLHGRPRPALVLGPAAICALPPTDDGVRHAAYDDRGSWPAPPEGGWATLVLVTDQAALRWAARVGGFAGLGRAKVIALALPGADAGVFPEVRPEWPGVAEVDVRHVGDDATTLLRFASPADVAEVLAGLARDAGPPGVDLGGLVLGPTSDAEVADAETPDPETKVPPDAVVGPARDTAYVVTGRPAPALATVTAGGLTEPVDEGVFGPRGFQRQPARRVVDLPPGPVTEAVVAGLRDALAVRVPSDLGPRDRAALEMAGLLLTSGEADPEWADPLRREEFSVVVRRAALDAHSSRPWAARVAERIGVRLAPAETVSILLATRRPEQLAFALRQVAKQQVPGGAELVLAAHGFAPDPGVVRDHLGDRPVTVLTPGADTLFGAVLAQATAAAAGEVVVKFDDDDWYGADVVADLLRARRYSGATLVGMPAEFVYLEPIDVTIRRPGPTETFGSVVAGGTMMIGRDDLAAVGGWRPTRRYVDAQVLAAVTRAGGAIYRAQGLGYLLRRTSTGHTWDPGLGYFLESRRVAAQWRGFAPSRLLVVDDAERPARPPGRGATITAARSAAEPRREG